jgi:hypothetical protein
MNPEEQYQKASKLKTINEFAVDLDRFLARTCDNTPPKAGQDKILPHGTSEFLVHLPDKIWAIDAAQPAVSEDVHAG